MKKWLFRILWIPVFLIALLFLVANRQLVPVSLDPFNAVSPAVSTPALPLWFWLIGMLFVGFAAGAAGAWFSARAGRQKARAEHRELKSLRREMADARVRLAAAEERLSEPAPPLLESVESGETVK